MKRFEPQLSILPPGQRRVWHTLAPAKRFHFVLYGGTGIALRLGHRSSLDFDFFSNEPLDRQSLSGAIPALAASGVLQDVRDTWTLLVDGVKVSFFGNLKLGRVGAPERTTDDVLDVASLDDLFGFKMAVLPQRVESRDYADIAAILRAGLSLERGLGCARALYGSQFQPNEALKALTYFEDGDFGALSSDDRRLLIQKASGVSEIPVVPLSGTTFHLPSDAVD